MAGDDQLVPYVGGPLAGGYSMLPTAELAFDAVHEERPIDPDTGRTERYLLRQRDDGWAFVYAGPVDDPERRSG